MKEKSRSTGMSERTSDIILVAICVVVLIIVAYPLYYVLVASFSDPYQVYAGKTFLLPSGFTLDGYKAVFAEGLMDVEMFSQSDSQLIAKCQQGYVGVSVWWYIEELMGDYAKDYVFLPPLTGPKGTQYENTCGVTIRPGSPISSGQLNLTNRCKSHARLINPKQRRFRRGGCPHPPLFPSHLGRADEDIGPYGPIFHPLFARK